MVIDLYRDMVDSQKCMPDARTFHLFIQACIDLSDFEVGEQVYSHAQSVGLQFNIFVGTSLIDMYCKAGDPHTAHVVFDGMPERDIVSWNILLSGLAGLGSLHDTMSLFRKMLRVRGMTPLEPTIVILVSACGKSSSCYCGDVVHSYVIKAGFELHLNICNCLIDMYSKPGCLRSSTVVFEALRERDCISWSTIIGGFVQNGCPIDALKLFDRMLLREKHIGLTKPILLNAILACANVGDLRQGRQIHESFIIGCNSFKSDVCLTTLLIHMYLKFGDMTSAFYLLNGIDKEKEDVIVWNALVKACMERKEVIKTSKVIQEMLRRGVLLNESTFILLISLFHPFPCVTREWKFMPAFLEEDLKIKLC